MNYRQILSLDGSQFEFHPRVLHHLFTCHSFFRLFHEKFAHKVFALLRMGLPVFLLKLVLAGLNLTKEGVLVLVEEWRLSRQEHESNNADAPIITFFTVWFLSKYLRSNVSRSSASSVGQLVRLELASKSEVSDFELVDVVAL